MNPPFFLFTIDADWVPGSAPGLEALLSFCEAVGIRSTIFTTGKFALAYPAVIRNAHAAGHEIGAHGWAHPMPAHLVENYRRTRSEQRRQWLALAHEAITATVGDAPRAFRAPFLWVDAAALRLLAEFNYGVDSSIPTRRFDGLLGMVNYREYFWAPLDPYYVDLNRPRSRGVSAILEIPPSAFMLPLNMSTLRFVGLRAMMAIVRILRRRSSILNFYCHPWEFVPASALEYPEGVPPRHLHGTGPHLLGPLHQFVEAVRRMGYRPATTAEVASCAW